MSFKISPQKIASLYLKKAQKIYYWTASSSKPVPPGTRVPAARISMNPENEAHRRIEEIFERVRREEFPNRPSRIGAKFVCPSLKGFCRADGYKKVYQVKVSGKAFQTNAEYYTEAFYSARGGASDERLASWARSYWKGGRAPFFPEVIVQGTVTIIGPIN